jgi:3-isopropylmalate/(R)-2-methylmalate dehydratase small subunit
MTATNATMPNAITPKTPAMEPFTVFASRAVVLPADDVDTDQIIPARFLTTTARTGLGRSLFSDWRYDAAGAPRPEFPLNAPRAAGARVLVAGRNFGCGSSREHAPWALADHGFRAVIATSFADIFRANALNVGLVPVALDEAHHRALLAALEADAEVEVTVDLERQEVRLPGADGAPWPFRVDPFARQCLLQGVDRLGFVLAAEAEIATHEATRPSPVRTAA